jgi:hypothetical protein
MADAASYTMSHKLDPFVQDQWKKEAAEAAAAQVKSGMVVGLGTGSTAKYAIDALGRRVAEEGLRIVGIATSERSNAQALALQIPMTSFADQSRIDLTIDGADEVLPGKLTLIKGSASWFRFLSKWFPSVGNLLRSVLQNSGANRNCALKTAARLTSPMAATTSSTVHLER